MSLGKHYRLAILTVLAGCVGIGGAAAATTELNASVGTGPKHPVTKLGWEPFVEAVKTQSGGDIAIKAIYGGALCGLAATANCIKSGAADAGFVIMAYTPAEFPHGKLLNDLALLGHTAQAMAGATTEFNLLHCADCMAEFTAQKIVYTGAFGTSPYHIISKGAINSLAEIKGKKLRSGGGSWNRLMAHLGAVASTVPGDDIFSALSKGMVDGTISSPSNIISWSLLDVVTDVSLIKLGTFNSTSVFNVNLDRWGRIPLEHRRILMANVPAIMAGPTIGYVLEGDHALAEAKKHNIRVREPDPAFAQAVAAFAVDDVKVIVAEAEGKGLKNVAGKIAQFRALIDAWEKKTADVGIDDRKLAAIYQREIFDRLDIAKFGM
ncbi:MAG: C4-dicarboxylate TRAP transporter substrate-binding protein [Alphaproteobacteria bacterium]